jgi:2-polyprenyl-3-methyl-5-hydroxy-6-metoxy-1,4-benzoquinol methylase
LPQNKAKEIEMTQANVDLLTQAGVSDYLTDASYAQVFDYLTQYVRMMGNQRLRILDLGCGSGNWSRRFAKCGNYVLGVDLSETVIELARKYTPPEMDNVQFVVGDILKIVSERIGTFDIIFFGGVLHHMDSSEINRIIEFLPRLLSAGGYVVAVEWNGAHIATWLRGSRDSPIRRLFNLSYSPNESPLNPWKLQAQFEQLGYRVLGIRGVRFDVCDHVKMYDPNYSRIAARILVKGITTLVSIRKFFSHRYRDSIYNYSQFVFVAQPVGFVS